MGDKLCQLTIVILRAFDKNILLIGTDNSMTNTIKPQKYIYDQ